MNIQTFLAFPAGRRTGNETLRSVSIGTGAVLGSLAGRARVVAGSAVLMVTGVQPGVVAEIAHAGTLPDQPIGQTDPEELDPAVGAGPGIVAVVAAMRAAASHDSRNQTEGDRIAGKGLSITLKIWISRNGRT